MVTGVTAPHSDLVSAMVRDKDLISQHDVKSYVFPIFLAYCLPTNTSMSQHMTSLVTLIPMKTGTPNLLLLVYFLNSFPNFHILLTKKVKPQKQR